MSHIERELLARDLSQYDIDKLTYSLINYCSGRGKYNIIGHIMNHTPCSICTVDEVYLLCENCEKFICDLHNQDVTVVHYNLVNGNYTQHLCLCRECFHALNLSLKCINCTAVEDHIDTCRKHSVLTQRQLIDFLTQ